jgi:ABC-type sulfate/molybdate transport systems ATPase subunit
LGVTHDREDAAALATRVIHMKDGRLVGGDHLPPQRGTSVKAT